MEESELLYSFEYTMECDEKLNIVLIIKGGVSFMVNELD